MLNFGTSFYGLGDRKLTQEASGRFLELVNVTAT
jgi:hypothetical protein